MRIYIPLSVLLLCVLVSCHGFIQDNTKNALFNGKRLGKKPYISSRLRDAVNKSQDTKQENGAPTVAPVSKRGIFSAIVSGFFKVAKFIPKGIKVAAKLASPGVTAASLVLTLTNALTGGCGTHRKICEYKDQIEAMEDDVLRMAGTLKTTYEAMTEDFQKTRDIFENNLYIERFIEKSLEDLETIVSISDEVDELVGRNVYRADLLGNQDMTSDEFFKQISQPNEKIILDFQDWWKETKATSLKAGLQEVGLLLAFQLVSMGIDAGIKRATNAFKNTGSYTLPDENGKKYGKVKNFLNRVKLTKLRPTLTTKNFKANTKAKIVAKWDKVKAQLKSPKSMVKKFTGGIKWSSTALNGINVAAGAVALWLEDQRWSLIEQELKDNVGYYQEYLEQLTNQTLELEESDRNMTRMVVEGIENFIDISGNFTNELSEGLQNSTILGVFSNSEVDEDTVQLASPGTVNTNNILSKQNEVRRILQDTGFAMETYQKWLESFRVTLQATADGIDKNETFTTIMNTLTSAFSLNSNIKSMAKDFIQISKVVCAAISIDPDKTQYANYPFDGIRELCVDASVQISTRKYVTEQQEFAKTSIIKTYTMDSGLTESLDRIHSRFENFFNKDPLHKLTDCKRTMIGGEYEGQESTTIGGKTCQQWDSQSPHAHNHGTMVPFGSQNYCRNPNNRSGGPWCYTMDSATEWQYCDVPVCECKNTPNGLDYVGTLQRTCTPCKPWSQTPYSSTLSDQKNYCRNPNTEESPWCYSNSTNEMVYCDVTPCSLMTLPPKKYTLCEIAKRLPMKTTYGGFTSLATYRVENDDCSTLGVTDAQFTADEAVAIKNLELLSLITSFRNNGHDPCLRQWDSLGLRCSGMVQNPSCDDVDEC